MSELGDEHKQALVVEHLDATSDAYKGLQAGFGFNNHGLLIRDKGGEIVFKQADHKVKAEDVRAFVEDYLKKK